MIHQLDEKKKTKAKTKGFPIHDTTFKFCPSGLETCFNQKKKQQRQKGFDKILSPKCRYRGFQKRPIKQGENSKPQARWIKPKRLKEKTVPECQRRGELRLFVCLFNFAPSQTHRFRQFSAGFLIRFLSESYFNFFTIFFIL